MSRGIADHPTVFQVQRRRIGGGVNHAGPGLAPVALVPIAFDDSAWMGRAIFLPIDNRAGVLLSSKWATRALTACTASSSNSPRHAGLMLKITVANPSCRAATASACARRQRDAGRIAQISIADDQRVVAIEKDSRSFHAVPQG